MVRAFPGSCWLTFNGFLENATIGAPGWRSRLSVRLQPGHDLAVREFEPRVGPCADSSGPGARFGFRVSLSLSAPPLLTLCLSNINKRYMNRETMT